MFLNQFGKKSVASLIAAVLCLCIATIADASTFLRMSMEEAVEQSDLVLIGKVTGGASRWESRGRFIVTDYEFLVDEELLNRSSKGMDAAGKLTFTLWGGTVGDVTDRMEGLPAPHVGENSILLLQQGDELDSFAAGDMSVFVISDTAGSGRQIVRGITGAQLSLRQRGSGTFLDRTTDGEDLRADALIHLLRSAATNQAGRSRPKSTETRGTFQDQSGDEHFLPELIPTDPGVSALARSNSTITPLSAEDNVLDRFDEDDAPGVLASSARSSDPSQFRSFGYANLPITFNQLPSAIVPWFPVDQHMMSVWNIYVPALFRVYATPTGNYAFGNNRFDVCGWPSSSDLLSVFGHRWQTNEVGVTFSRQSGSRIVEADIALNPAFNWTLNDLAVYLGTTTAMSFRQTMLHELGHAWGADHEFNRLATMNYLAQWVRGNAVLYADDAASVRARYPLAASRISDMAVYLYRYAGLQSVTTSEYPSSAWTGTSITIKNVTVENVGTITRAPRLDFYLATAPSWTGTEYHLGSVTSASLTSGSSRVSDYTLTVPSSVPAGSYYLAVVARAVGYTDPASTNNTAFSRTHGITISASLSCSATASATSGYAPLSVSFSGKPSGGLAPYVVKWSFGDGSPSVTFASGTHRFARPGSYTSTFSVRDGRGSSCSKQIGIKVTLPPPNISVVLDKNDPFRLLVKGENFQRGAVIMIDHASAPGTGFLSAQKLVAKGGSALEAMVPKGVQVRVRVVNPDGSQSDWYSFTR